MMTDPWFSPHMHCEVRHQISWRFIGVTLTTSLNYHTVCVPRVLSNMVVVRTQARVPYINIQCSVTLHFSSLCTSIQTALDENMGHQFPFLRVTLLYTLLYKAEELSSLLTPPHNLHPTIAPPSWSCNSHIYSLWLRRQSPWPCSSPLCSPMLKIPTFRPTPVSQGPLGALS